MEPDTGAILAMVSKPDYNPNTIVKDWTKLNMDEDNSPLLNRATQGLYPPGSTFKTLTLLEYIRENGNYNDYSFKCKGQINIDTVSYTHLSGIGPKVALGILSVLTPDDITYAVLSDDIAAIAKAPGIGKNTAGKLILELKDKVDDTTQY